MPYRHRIEPARQSLLERFPQLAGAAEAAPFIRFDQIQSAQAPMRGYTYVSDCLASFMKAVPMPLQEAYLCNLLLWHIDRFEEVFSASDLDPEFRLQAIDSIHRILDQIENSTDWARIGRDSYMKDLGIVRLSLLAAVGQLIYPFSGIWRSKVLKGGPHALWHVYGRCGGPLPFLELHTHDQMAKDYFNPAGWEETYRLAAKAFKTFPQAKGLLSTSWYFDPKLGSISPRLAYLREKPLSNGGYFLRIGTSASAIRLATGRSSTRRRLFEEGKYVPVSYALIWARKDILRNCR